MFSFDSTFNTYEQIFKNLLIQHKDELLFEIHKINDKLDYILNNINNNNNNNSKNEANIINNKEFLEYTESIGNDSDTIILQSNNNNKNNNNNNENIDIIDNDINNIIKNNDNIYIK